MKTALKICAAVFGFIGVVFLGVGIGVCYVTGLRWPLIHAGIGAVFLILAICFVIYLCRRSSTEKRLLETGTRIQANIDDVTLNYSVRVNWRHPYVIQCSWLDPQTQQVYVFHSDSIWYNPMPYLGDRTTLPVYIDPDNPRRYMVDTEGILPPKG